MASQMNSGASDPLLEARNYVNPMFIPIDRLPCEGNVNNHAAVNVTDLLAVISERGACEDTAASRRNAVSLI